MESLAQSEGYYFYYEIIYFLLLGNVDKTEVKAVCVFPIFAFMHICSHS